jgi:hypothetical protein
MIKSVTEDLFKIDGVLGILIFSADEKILFQDLSRLEIEGLPANGLDLMLSLFHDTKEADLLFDSYRISIRNYPSGFVCVIMRPDTSAAMIRLQCDVLAPELEAAKPKKKGISRFFR